MASHTSGAAPPPHTHTHTQPPQPHPSSTLGAGVSAWPSTTGHIPPHTSPLTHPPSHATCLQAALIPPPPHLRLFHPYRPRGASWTPWAPTPPTPATQPSPLTPTTTTQVMPRAAQVSGAVQQPACSPVARARPGPSLQRPPAHCCLHARALRLAK